MLLPTDTLDEDLVVWSISLDPSDPKTIYVGTQNTSVFRSRDDGYSFERLVIPEPEGAVCSSFAMRVIGIAVAIVSDINNGKFNLLKWDRQEQMYYPLEINLYEKGKIDD